MAHPPRPMHFLITGAARGIGRGLTRALLSQGHRVFLLDANAPELEHTLSRAAAWATVPDAFHGERVDLADRARVRQAVAAAGTFFGGRLDCLVNNAFATPHIWRDGGKAEDGIEGKDDEDAIMAQWDEKIAVGLTAPFLLSRLCVPLLLGARDDMGKSPGSIVNISSTRALQAEPDHEAYSTAKAGLLGLTRSLAISLGERHHIRVNAIIPGWICVDDESRAADEQGTKWWESMSDADHQWHPAGRVGKVDDVVKALRFLVESGFVTGEEIVLDGGVGRKMVYPEE